MSKLLIMSLNYYYYLKLTDHAKTKVSPKSVIFVQCRNDWRILSMVSVSSGDIGIVLTENDRKIGLTCFEIIIKI